MSHRHDAGTVLQEQAGCIPRRACENGMDSEGSVTEYGGAI